MIMINISDIVSWLYCPRKIYLSKIKKIRQPMNKAMLIGRLKHNVIEIFSKSEQTIVERIDKDYDNLELYILYENFLKTITNRVFLTNKKIIESFKVDRQEVFKKILEDFSEDIKVRIQSIKQAIKQGYFKEALWKNLHPKYISELKLESESLGLRGRVDRIEVDNGMIIPYEIKTREGKVYLSDEIQLTAYAMLLQDHYKLKIDKGIVEVSGKKNQVPITNENKQKVLEIAEKIRNIEENLPPKLQSNFNKCRNCGFKKHCFGE